MSVARDADVSGPDEVSVTAVGADQTGGAVDLSRLDGFMAKVLTGDEGAAVSRAQLSGGMSQMTVIYGSDRQDGTTPAQAEQLVVRVAPTSGPLEPYDPVVEATLMTTVAGFGIATPEVALIEPTGSAIGRPFYATRFVSGAMTAEGLFGPTAERDRMAEAYVDQLAALHAVPVDEEGAARVSLSTLLGTTPRKTPAAVIERWSQALARHHLRIPAYQQFLREWLVLRIPADEGRHAVVHGDYRLANMLWTDDSRIAAAMDWEETGLGDPYSDLAWTLMGTFDDDDDVLGLASRRWILERYAAQAGIEIDPQRLLWWEVAAGWALLCMNAVACAFIIDGSSRDIRPLLYSYLNRRIAGGPLRKIDAYERALLMDYVNTAAVLRALVRAIEDSIPDVSDSYKRSQLWAATGILGNIANDLELPPDAARESVGENLAGLLRSAGLERAIEDGEGAADAAALLRENLDAVIDSHATLHYRRAVGGFDD